jgi:hypothetical protein
LFVATADLPRSAGHVFYEKLNELLTSAGFDDYVEALCAPYYDAKGNAGATEPTAGQCRPVKRPCIGHFGLVIP